MRLFTVVEGIGTNAFLTLIYALQCDARVCFKIDTTDLDEGCPNFLCPGAPQSLMDTVPKYEFEYCHQVALPYTLCSNNDDLYQLTLLLLVANLADTK